MSCHTMLRYTKVFIPCRIVSTRVLCQVIRLFELCPQRVQRPHRFSGSVWLRRPKSNGPVALINYSWTKPSAWHF